MVIAKCRKILLIVSLDFSIIFFLISYFNKNKIKVLISILEQSETYKNVVYKTTDYCKSKNISYFSIEGGGLFKRTSIEIIDYHDASIFKNKAVSCENKSIDKNKPLIYLWNKKICFPELSLLI